MLNALKQLWLKRKSTDQSSADKPVDKKKRVAGFLKRMHFGHVLAPLTLGLLVFIIPGISFAQELDVGSVAKELMDVLVVAFSFLTALLYPMLMISSALMDNEIIVGAGMEGTLLAIWTEIRNWVNIGFVMILVGIALYNVVGIAGDGSNYALKSILPKLVIGLVAVNFSFLAVKLLIDATGVLTTAVYALPTDLISWDEEVEKMQERLCGQVVVEDDGTQRVDLRSTTDAPFLSVIFCEEGEDGYYYSETTTDDDGNEALGFEFNSFGDEFFAGFGQHNATLALFINMGQATDLDIITEAEAADAGAAELFSKMSIKMLFNILMILMFGFAYAALIVVLVARVVVLWISLALSPFIVLIFVFPDLANVGGGDLDLKTQFIQHLFVPVILGIVFSTGFMMLSVLQGTESGSWLGKIGDVSLSELSDSQKIKDMQIMYGNDLSDFQSLIVAASAIIIMWVGTFAAASKTVASSWTDAIKGAGESTGKFLAKTPLYATAIPVPGRKTADGKQVNYSFGDLISAPLKMGRIMQQRREERSGDLARNLLGEGSATEKAHRSAEQSFKRADTLSDAQNEIRNLARSENFQSADWRFLQERGKSFLTAGGLTGGVAQEIMDARTSDEILNIVKNDPTAREKILGDDWNNDEWGSERGSSSDASSGSDAAVPAAPAGGSTLDPATAAATGAAATVAAVTAAKGKGGTTLDATQAAKVTQESLVGTNAQESAKRLFGDDVAMTTQLQAAIERTQTAAGQQRQSVVQGTAIKGDYLDPDKFIQQVEAQLGDGALGDILSDPTPDNPSGEDPGTPPAQGTP